VALIESGIIRDNEKLLTELRNHVAEAEGWHRARGQPGVGDQLRRLGDVLGAAEERRRRITERRMQERSTPPIPPKMGIDINAPALQLPREAPCREEEGFDALRRIADPAMLTACECEECEADRALEVIDLNSS